ncbi:MAG: hypothetical protein VX733_12565 [Candidatus Latescibacterota bacterium]|nr:hypothetical protein [Candidatus Latescibacterota bacterium]
MYEWTCITKKAAFAGRDGAGSVTFDGQMWLLGGWNPQDKVNFPQICNSEVWASRDGEIWTEVEEQAPWEGRHTAGYAVHDGRMWIVGGDCIQGHTQTDVWASSDGSRWECVCGRVPWAPRSLHYTAVHDGRIWVMGGQTVPQFDNEPEEIFYRDVWCSADGTSWERVCEQAPWSERGMIGGSAVHDGRIWILGGGTYETPRRNRREFQNDVWSSADGVNWECHIATAPWVPRQYHEVAVWDDRLWVMEGCYNEAANESMAAAAASGQRWNRNDVWFSSDGVEWAELPDTPWAPRHAASVFVYRDALWMVTGNNMEPDVWRLTRRPVGSSA